MMENGIKILIERLKTNPEEFLQKSNRWMNTILTYRDFMSVEDRVALDEALHPVLMERFNEEVLNTLMRTEQELEQLDLDFGAGNGGSTITLTKGRGRRLAI